MRLASKKSPQAIVIPQVTHQFSLLHNINKFDTGSNESGQVRAAQLIKLAATPSFCSCRSACLHRRPHTPFRNSKCQNTSIWIATSFLNSRSTAYWLRTLRFIYHESCCPWDIFYMHFYTWRYVITRLCLIYEGAFILKAMQLGIEV